MQKVEIIFDESWMKEMQMILKQSGIAEYTLLENVKGRGQTGAKFNTSAAPGINAMLIVVLDETRAKTLSASIRKFRDTNPGVGVRMIVSDIKEFL